LEKWWDLALFGWLLFLHIMHIVFETPRLYLRRFTSGAEDARLIFELNSDPEVLKYLHEPMLKDETHAGQILENTILPQYEKNLGRWAIHLKENHAFIGWCGLKYRPELDETDLGYRLKKSAWGLGYASEAAVATLRFGFETLGLSVITGRAHIENTASLIILEKIGMQYVRDEIIDNCPVKTFSVTNPDPEKFVKEK
jgi:RimJ/RimL family protein N-acetyltransferase